MSNPQQESSLPDVQVTDQDMARLRSVAEKHADGRLADAAEALELELDRAEIVPQASIPPDVVTMRSRVLCRDLESGRTREIALVYPEEADASAGKVSILAPMGVALLGLRGGATIRWPLPNGRHVTLELLEVCYQPEVAGELSL